MPIVNTVQGDLLEMFKTQFDGIAHGCNSTAAMGAGIAGQIREQYPEAYVTDRIHFKSFGHNPYGVLGSISVTDHFFGKIFNLYTQLYPGQERSERLYKNVRLSFERLNKWVSKYEHEGFSLGIPMIGAGIAGGDWEVIKEIINEVTPDIDITVVEYVPSI